MRKRTLLDFDWKFHRGDIPFVECTVHEEAYASTKGGYQFGAASPSFDDSRWEEVRLPHDFIIDQPFDAAATVSNGYLHRGVAFYRRAFVLDPAAQGRHFSIEFDGAFRDAQVWLNGHYLGQHPSGYTGFDYSISDIAFFGGVPNVLVVRVDTRHYEGWWYEGGGLYRHVWLVETAPLHVAKWGVCVRTHRIDEGRWRVEVQTELANRSVSREGCEVVHQIIAPDGRTAAETSPGGHEVEGSTTCVDQQEAKLKNPALWSLETPALHTLRTIVRQGETVLDEVKTRFGIRECRFSPDEGFFLNGKHVKLHGSCNHQNHAGVGTAIPDSLQRWRLRKLKEAGCNAYRASHYPSTPELLDICDEEGILVLEENRYLSTSPGAMADMESMVRRDRNHPSVFLWSICNEEFLDTSEIGFRLATSQMARLKQLDSTRPVTAALILSSNGAGVDKATDVVAVNYRNEGWDDVHRHHPSQAIVVTESTALKSTRGIYNKDAAGRYIPAYDEVHDMFDLRTTVRRTCLDVQERPHIAGNFVWAGFNYRGEGGAWPRTCAQSGFLDLCGFPKDAFYLYQAFWTGKPMVHLLPHWNWPGKEGQAIRVVAYSNCERVELFLNGKSVGGEQAVPHDHMVEWSVPYQPGILRAEARRGGGIAIQAEVRTSGEPAGIRLSCNTETLRADIEDTAVVTVEIVDSEGTPVPTADILTRFTIEGPGMIIGTGNGDPTSLEPDKASQRTTFNALAQILIQTTGGAGDIVLTAAADRLSSATLKIAAAAAPRRPFLPGPASLQNVGNWRRSPFLDTAPDPSDPSYDPTAWEAFAQLSGFPSFLRQGQWTGYHAKLVIPKPGTWRLAFSRVHGAGAVFINGKQLCEIAQRTESFSVDLPDLPAGRGISLDLRLQNISGGAGLFGCVWLYETASQ